VGAIKPTYLQIMSAGFQLAIRYLNWLNKLLLGRREAFGTSQDSTTLLVHRRRNKCAGFSWSNRATSAESPPTSRSTIRRTDKTQ
jgi:hypothetical protein